MAANQAPTALADAANSKACAAVAPLMVRIGNDNRTPRRTARPARLM